MSIRLQRLPSNFKITNPDGTPTAAMSLYIQRMCEQIEASINGIQEALDAAASADAAAVAANAAAALADAAAVSAQGVANQVQADSSLANSFTTGLTISATDAGASATITISAHSRVYGDGTTVAVSGGSVTGLAYSSDYWAGYVQASRAGGAVTYTASTSIQGNGTSADYHFVGAVATPAAAAPPNTGNPVLPPGANLP